MPEAETIDGWLEKYKPIANMVEGRAMGFEVDGAPTFYETYGQDLAAVKRQMEEDPSKVWTLIETDDERLCVMSGRHFANRLGYAITEVGYDGRFGAIQICYD